MSAADMEGFTSILQSEHPEADLFGCPPGELKPRDATLRAGSLVRCVLSTPMDTQAITFDAPVPFVRTFSDDGKSTWVEAIVPGYGRCRVQRRDLVFNSNSNMTSRGGRGGSITSLRLRFYKEDPVISDGLVTFFRAIGSSLKHLALDAPMDDLSSILQCCPNLEELNLTGRVVDARLDFSDYHAKGESLPELRLNRDSISETAAALADNDNPLVKCAHRIRVRVKDFSDEEEDSGAGSNDHIRDTIRDFISKMLEANKYLEFLEIVANPAYDRYLQSFRVHHLKPIWRTLNPLLLESKIAFLSICLPKTSPERSRKLQTHTGARMAKPLNQHVLANIFEYAADPVLRQVYFCKSHRIKLDLLFDDALV